MTTPALKAIVLQALQSLTGPQSAAGDILDLFATDIATASWEAQSPLETPLQRALALVAIARTESGRFDPRVLTCDKRGLLGEVTAFQLMPNRARTTVLGIPIRELCPTNQLAATVALRVLDRPCAKGGKNLRGMFRGYAAGNCATHSDVATKQHDTYVQLKLRYQHDYSK